MSAPALPSDPTNSTRSSPNIAAADAILHIGSSTFIDAPSIEVWRILTDTSTWPTWNSFVPRAIIREQPSGANPNSTVLQVGTKMTFRVRMDPSAQNEQDAHLTVTELDPPDPDSDKLGRIVWAGDTSCPGSFPAWLLSAERVHEFKEVEVEMEGGDTKRMTEVRNWEAQTGYVAYAVKWLYGTVLQGDFETWVADLKRFLEERKS
ncbi:hypothetical protein PHISP_06465 [Aspergillus sp. HF37]|nr:hypothetical protein PHISP_06465 [Aspergillus sp. HF37]